MTDSPVAAAADRRPPLVLVVDDDPTIRGIMRDVLEEEGFAVATAANGPQAIQRAAQRPPALVILDVGLPLMDGEQVAISLRADHGPRLRILMVSAAPGVADKARQIGAVGYLRKPFDLGDLIDAVQRVVQGQ